VESRATVNIIQESIEPGSSFGKWVVVGENPHRRHGKILCCCECGTEREVLIQNLTSGRSSSCGCSSRCSCDKIKPGAVFGKWTVLEENPHTRKGAVLCRCACGREKLVLVSNLLQGLSKSCGCSPRIVPGMMQGRIYVVGHPWLDSKGRKRVKCYCECGRTWFPRTDDLLHGRTQSCRCFHFSPDYRRRMREKAVSVGMMTSIWDLSFLGHTRA